jgi:hypothetical protein
MRPKIAAARINADGLILIIATPETIHPPL